MKAVILAAGLGGRLRPITGAIPKCMVPVNGVRIIDKQIRNLKEAGVEDVVVVSGYKAELLEKHLADTWPGVRTVRNVRHAETNNMYSLFLAREAVRGCGFLLMNADVYFDGGENDLPKIHDPAFDLFKEVCHTDGAAVAGNRLRLREMIGFPVIVWKRRLPRKHLRNTCYPRYCKSCNDG